MLSDMNSEQDYEELSDMGDLEDRRAWGIEEDRRVCELVQKYGNKKWALVGSYIEGRSGKQCRERWHNHLNPGIVKMGWSREEDRILIDSHKRLRSRWSEISKLLPGRTDNAIKNRWNSTMRRVARQHFHDIDFSQKKKKAKRESQQDLLYQYCLNILYDNPYKLKALLSSNSNRKKSNLNKNISNECGFIVSKNNNKDCSKKTSKKGFKKNNKNTFKVVSLQPSRSNIYGPSAILPQASSVRNNITTISPEKHHVQSFEMNEDHGVVPIGQIPTRDLDLEELGMSPQSNNNPVTPLMPHPVLKNLHTLVNTSNSSTTTINTTKSSPPCSIQCDSRGAWISLPMNPSPTVLSDGNKTPIDTPGNTTLEEFNDYWCSLHSSPFPISNPNNKHPTLEIFKTNPIGFRPCSSSPPASLKQCQFNTLTSMRRSPRLHLTAKRIEPLSVISHSDDKPSKKPRLEHSKSLTDIISS